MSDEHDDVLSIKNDSLCITRDDGEDRSFSESATSVGFTEEQAYFLEKIVKLVLF